MSQLVIEQARMEPGPAAREMAPDAASSMAETLPPLCVDLDGTLIATDVLWESALLLIATRPWMALRMPGWLLRGKAYLKQRLAREVNLNVGVLPYRAEVVTFVREQRAAGQRTILATASDESVARAVAAQVGVFDDVIASDGHSNLRGPAKLRAVRQRLGGGAFDYIGDSSADMALWEAARQAFVVGSKRQVRRAAQVCSPTEIETAPRGGCQGLVKALRPQQWAKNVLLGVPLIVSHNLGHWADVMAVAVAFVAFGMAASAIYLVNDLLDLEADRQHPRKCRRPFASGRVSVQAGAAAVVPLLLGSALLALGMLPVGFVGMLGMYVALSLAYSLYLKRKMLVDVFCLAGLYTLRILAGAVAIGVVVSPWLLAFSMFLFLSLAFVKRYSELKLMGGGSQGAARGRGYVAGDLETFRSMGPTSGYLAVLVLCLYINSADVLKLYHRPGLLWLVCPVVLYWITRIWFLVQRYEMPDDPVNFALRDRVSYLAGAVIAAIIALATVS